MAHPLLRVAIHSHEKQQTCSLTASIVLLLFQPEPLPRSCGPELVGERPIAP